MPAQWKCTRGSLPLYDAHNFSVDVVQILIVHTACSAIPVEMYSSSLPLYMMHTILV